MCIRDSGSPETVKGMKILYTSQTTVHYMVGKWLKILGLTENDVTLVNMEQPSAVPAFEKGIGDAVCLWAPFTFCLLYTSSAYEIHWIYCLFV